MAKNKIYITEFDADGRSYIKKLDQLEAKTHTATSKMQASVGKVNDAYLKMAGVVASLGAVTSFIKDSIQAFSEEEKIVKRLDTALGKHNKTLQAYASHLQKITTFADDQVLSAMALISNYVKEESTVKKLTKATLDFATAKEVDLSTAAELVAKTVGSSTNALGRYGVQIDNNAVGVDRINAVLEQLAIYQGQAEAQAETYSGKLQILNNQFGDMQEAIGAGVIPTLTEFGDVLGSLAGKIDSSGISGLLDKWLKLALIVPRMGLKGIGALADLVTGGENLNPADFITNSASYTNGINNLLNKTSNKDVTNNRTGNKNSIPMINGRRMDNPQRYLDAVLGNAGTRGFDINNAGISEIPKQLTEVAIPELKSSFEEIGTSFVNKFGETQNIAHQIGNIFNVSADSFVGKLMQAFDVGSSILSIISSIANLAGGGPLGLLGLAEGGTVVNKGGRLSYVPIPKFARGGSYTVPPGYNNDSGLIRVQSGERVDVTPSKQVPALSKLLTQIDNKLAAANMNSGRKNNQPVNVTLKIDGKTLGLVTQKNLNRLTRSNTNLGEQ